ncbi:hypothetical protein BC936DRAFT_137296 [Jimgerdemannia flammicorona]|uniref:Uncharacterized protein n=1 Tax=Jimgerdemannia flammicorona TaxID=994334 RepID=A0A433CXP4_9FUNG|nr:hypothetical protein BC936DRAFT_137296 [Jimgerdemannia flammicorona]
MPAALHHNKDNPIQATIHPTATSHIVPFTPEQTRAEEQAMLEQEATEATPTQQQPRSNTTSYVRPKPQQEESDEEDVPFVSPFSTPQPAAITSQDPTLAQENRPPVTPRRLLRSLARAASAREDDNEVDMPTVTRAPLRLQDTSRTLLKNLSKATSVCIIIDDTCHPALAKPKNLLPNQVTPRTFLFRSPQPPPSPPLDKNEDPAPPAPLARHRGRPPSLQLDLVNNPFHTGGEAGEAAEATNRSRSPVRTTLDGSGSPKRRGSGSPSPAREDYPTDLPYSPDSPQTPSLPSIAEESESENEEAPVERHSRATTTQFPSTRRSSNARRPSAVTGPLVTAADTEAARQNDHMYHAMHRVLKNVQGRVREFEPEAGEMSFRSRSDSGPDDRERRRDLLEEVERMRKEVEASNRDLIALRQQLGERDLAEDEVDRRLGEVTARVQGLREQVRERDEGKRRRPRDLEVDGDEDDDIEEEEDEEGESASSSVKSSDAVAGKRKWFNAGGLLLLFLVVEMLVLWVIVG